MVQDLRAQQTPKLEPENDSFSRVYFKPGKSHLYGLDTLRAFEYRVDSFYNSYYPELTHYRWFLNLGNTGSPSQGLAFRLRPHEGFSMGFQAFDLMMMDPTFIPLLRVKVPFTRLNYTQGAKELMQVGASFTHNVKPNWNIGLDFRRMKSDGFYLNQATGSYNTRLFTWWHSKSSRYHLAAQIVLNRIQNDENAGIVSDSLFENTDAGLRIVPVNIGTSGNPARQKIAGTHYVAHQQVRLGKKQNLPHLVPTEDPSLADSVRTFVTGLTLNSQTSFNTHRWAFTDPQNPRGFFRDYFYDTTKTYDSTRQRNLSNRFSISNAPVRYDAAQKTLVPVPVLFNVYSLVDAIWLDGSQDWKDSYLNTAAGITLNSNIFYDTLNFFNADARYFFSGYNSRDWHLNAAAGRWLGKINLGGEALIVRRKPFYNDVFINHNNFRWNNFDFEEIYSRGFSVNLGLKSDPGYPVVSVSWQVLENPVYYDTSGLPVQHAGRVNISSIRLRKRLHLGKWYWDQHWELQNSSDDRAVRIPGMLVWQSFYRQSEAFKGKMALKTGFEGYYYSQFLAQVYNPSTRQFQLQDRVLIGNYPIIDFFTTFRVKTFRLFLRTEHLTQNLFGRRYYASPHQPWPPRTFRFGISWWFFD